MKAHSAVTVLLFLFLVMSCTMQAGAENLNDRLKRDARLHEELGDGYFHRGSMREAALEWEKAIRLMPEYPSPYFKLASVYCRSGLVEKSIYYLEHGLKYAPSNAFGHYSLAVLQLQTGRYDQAESHLIAALRILPGRGSALACMCNGTTSSYAETIPVSLRARSLLGFLYLKRGERKRAIFELRQSFLPLPRLCSSDSPSLRAFALMDFMLGESLSLSGSGLDAVVRSPHFIAFTDQDGRVLYRRDAALMLSKKRELVTEEGCRTGIVLPDKISEVAINEDGTITGISDKTKSLTIGRLHLFSFRSPWALRALRGGYFTETAESGTPENASPGACLLTPRYRRMGLPLSPAGDDWSLFVVTAMKALSDSVFCSEADSVGIDDEIAIYEAALSSPQRSWMRRDEILSHLGSLYYQKGDAKRALDSLSQAAACTPGSPFIHFNKGFIHWKAGRHDDAAKEFSLILKDEDTAQGSEKPDMLTGRTLFFLGLYEKEKKAESRALQYLNDSMALDPSTGYEAYLPVAEILAEKGDKTSSLIYLFEFLNGCVTATNRPLDIAIFGDASFRLKDGSGKTVLSRRGSFRPTKDGEIITDEGLHTGIMLPEGAHDLWFSEDGELSGFIQQKEKKKFGRLEIVGGSAGIKSRFAGGALNKKTLLGADEVEGWRLLACLTSASGGSFHTVCRALVECQSLKPVMADPGPWPTDPVTGQSIYVKPPPPAAGPSLWERPSSPDTGEILWRKPLPLVSSGDEAWQLFCRYLRVRANIDEKLFEEKMKQLNEKSPQNTDTLTSVAWKKVFGEALKELDRLPCRDNAIVICLSEAMRGADEQGKAPKDVMEAAIRDLESVSCGQKKSLISAFYCGWIFEKLGDTEQALRYYQQFLDMEEKGSCCGKALPLPLRARIMRLNGVKDFTLLDSLFPENAVTINTVFSPPFTGVRNRAGVSITALSSDERVLYALSRSGFLHEKKGSFDKAIAFYRKFIQMRGLENPDISAFILQSLTMAYYEAGLLDEVRNELDLMNLDIQARNLSLATLFTLLGDAYLKKGEEGKAYECFATARRIQIDLGLPEQGKSGRP
ncbi:MAG: tetratricopeptide repeat protein [Candidatus Xenobiia bacterium LiM19]